VSPTARELVLVVDDEPMIRRMIARIVRDAGHDVETAACAAEARDWLGTAEFALIICDLRMPGESGAELAGWVRTTHPDVAVLIATATNDAEVAEAALRLGAYGYLVKPFKRNEVSINIANALRRRRLEIENREHRERLEQRVSERTAMLKRSQEEMIRRLSMAIESRCRETGEHVERIGCGAAWLGARHGLDDAHCEMLQLAAVLHDVGKIGIADRILLKPGRLTDEEHRVMEEHAEIGHRLLSGSETDLLDLAALIAWTHHERVDGTGYPRGLRGADIPIEGRITAIADVFDALTHDRVYRPALTVPEAIELMRRGRSGQFDADLFDLFFSVPVPSPAQTQLDRGSHDRSSLPSADGSG
jgi:putative two-component system response regulator